MSTELVVQSVEFTPEGLSISYGRIPADIRKNGLVWQHSVLVPLGTDYDDEIEEVVSALDALMVDVLDDEERAEPIDPAELNPNPEDEDDDADD